MVLSSSAVDRALAAPTHRISRRQDKAELNIISCLSQRDRNELTRVLRRLHLALDTAHQNVPGAGVEPTSP
jgi:hypothetical protein